MDKQCAEYAKKELRLDDDFAFMEYEDKGLSGYFSARPAFQRMLRDVQDGKIRAIVCYKLDRVGRKNSIAFSKSLHIPALKSAHLIAIIRP